MHLRVQSVYFSSFGKSFRQVIHSFGTILWQFFVKRSATLAMQNVAADSEGSATLSIYIGIILFQCTQRPMQKKLLEICRM